MKKLFWLILSTLFCLFLIFLNTKVFFQRKSFSFKREALEREIERFNKTMLKADITEEEEAEYLEKVAREELNFKKEGETVVSFPSATSSESFENEGFFQKMLKKVR